MRKKHTEQATNTEQYNIFEIVFCINIDVVGAAGGGVVTANNKSRKQMRSGKKKIIFG